MVMAAESSTDPSKMMTVRKTAAFFVMRGCYAEYMPIPDAGLNLFNYAIFQPFGMCKPRHRILHTQNLDMLSPEIQTADRFGKVQKKISFGSSAWKTLGDDCGIVGFRIRRLKI